jgi:hypothetical protein
MSGEIGWKGFVCHAAWGRILSVLITCAIAVPAGCAGGGGTSRGAEADRENALSNTDPCAANLHDIAGAMLLYYLSYGDLPADVYELQSAPGQDEPLSFVCPVSRRPYVYRPDGFLLPEKNVRIVLFDASPAHAGVRWAISAEEPLEGEPLVMKVIVLPESIFRFLPAQ